jgi:hypothetical protein
MPKNLKRAALVAGAIFLLVVVAALATLFSTPEFH